MKHVLVTAGTVYGPLDANKLVGNRVRGIWAVRFADYLLSRGVGKVTLLIPDSPKMSVPLPSGAHYDIDIIEHKGFADYHQKCRDLAPKVDAVVMAAAVVNWIPMAPFIGKMPTKGFKPGDVISIPFVLAPYVIDDMKAINPKLTLIGCKMLVDAPEEELITAAYDILLRAKCNMVIANDMGRGLHRKLVVNKDRSIQEFNDDWEGFYETLYKAIMDEHYHTGWCPPEHWMDTALVSCRRTFDLIVERYRDRFVPRGDGRVFGAVAVRHQTYSEWLVSPREKGDMFTSGDATLVDVNPAAYEMQVPMGSNKPTLNAPLMVRFGQLFGYPAVVHFHEEVRGLPVVEYAPPGTVRDNNRNLPVTLRRGFNIKGHGCILPVNLEGDIICQE